MGGRQGERVQSRHPSARSDHLPPRDRPPGKKPPSVNLAVRTGFALFGRLRLDDCGKLSKRRLFGTVALGRQCGTFRRLASLSDRFYCTEAYSDAPDQLFETPRIVSHSSVKSRQAGLIPKRCQIGLQVVETAHYRRRSAAGLSCARARAPPRLPPPLRASKPFTLQEENLSTATIPRSSRLHQRPISSC